MDEASLSRMVKALQFDAGTEVIELLDKAENILKEKGMLSLSNDRKIISLKHSVQSQIGIELDPPKTLKKKPYKKGYLAVVYVKHDIDRLAIGSAATSAELAEILHATNKEACEILHDASRKPDYSFRANGLNCQIEFVKTSEI